MRVIRAIQDQRGVALPMALMSLMLLTTLMLSFSVLAQTEPVIGSNHLRVAQARAMADSGLERAKWALTNSTDPNGIATPLPSPVPAPYNGSALITMSSGAGATLGGFVVTVAADPGGDPNTRQVTSAGWTPTNVSTDPRTKAHRTIQALVNIIPNLALNAPCALCVKGGLQVTGDSAINGVNLSGGCGGNNKYGTFTKDATEKDGSSTIVGGAGGVAQNQPASAFDAFTFTTKTLDNLKELAKKNGTYFGPGYPNGGTTPTSGTYSCQTVAFDSWNRVNNGIVFVDTCDGTNPTSNTPSGNIARVDIHGNPFTGQPGSGEGSPTSDSPGVFTGWMIVNGSLMISGNMRIDGMVYAANDLVYNGTGTGAINGLAISQNIIDTQATVIDSSSTGNAVVNFDCAKASGSIFVPASFNLLPGTYREIPG